MVQGFFSTGQVARQLNVAQSMVRTLCVTGAISAETTPGGQWRIPVMELDRLKRDGIPDVPRPMPGEASRAAARHALLADPSESAIDAADEVVRLESQVQSLGLKRQVEEGLDWFRERERQAAARKEAQQQQMETERQNSERRRRWDEWRNECLARAMRYRTWDIPKEADLDIAREVSAVLETLGPDSPESFVRSQVEGAACKGLAPWRERKDTEDAIQGACDSVRIPYTLRQGDDFQGAARMAARDSIEKLPAGSSREEKLAAARRTVEEVQRNFEHSATVRAVLHAGVSGLRAASTQEGEEAAGLIRSALASLPAGTSRGQMERASEEAVKPIRAAIEARQDRSMREHVMTMARWDLFRVPEEAKRLALAEIEEALWKIPCGAPQSKLEQARDGIIERAKNKHQLVEDGVREIFSYLRRLRDEKRLSRNDGLMTLDSKLQEKIRPALVRELNGSEPMDDVLKQVRRAVREALRIPPQKYR